jgi:ribosomal protein L37E
MKNDYKELPCRRCGRVWKWAFDKKTVPYCPEGYGCTVEGPTTREIFDEVFKRLDKIEKKIETLRPVTPPPTQPIYPTSPVPPELNKTVCSKCGMEWKGAMAYVCSSIDCPIQPKVMSISTDAAWQTYNISSTTGPFDVESLDPDERSWYYDGDGTKRRKE